MHIYPSRSNFRVHVFIALKFHLIYTKPRTPIHRSLY